MRVNSTPWVRGLAHKLSQWPCRQCGGTVKVMDEMCAHCGTYGPVQVPNSVVIKTAVLTACLIAVTAAFLFY